MCSEIRQLRRMKNIIKISNFSRLKRVISVDYFFKSNNKKKKININKIMRVIINNYSFYFQFKLFAQTSPDSHKKIFS